MVVAVKGMIPFVRNLILRRRAGEAGRAILEQRYLAGDSGLDSISVSRTQ
jgi:hypothetical protein